MICDFFCYCKLFLNKCEIDCFIGVIECDGFFLIVIVMYWKKCWVKLEFYFVKGKKMYDKCEDGKNKDWVCEKECLMKYKV